MHRRAFLKTSTAVSALAVAVTLPRLVAIVRADEKVFDPRPGTWRTFEITTRAEVLQPTGVTRVWLPIPVVNSEYQRTLGDRWSGNAKIMRPMTRLNSSHVAISYAVFCLKKKKQQLI